MEQAHTPGPWEGWEVHPPKSFKIYSKQTVVAEGVQGAADALLICAAPDMLAALRTAAEYFEILSSENMIASDALETVQAAIAKATGTQPLQQPTV